MKPKKGVEMTVVIGIVARFLARTIITVIWALILSKLIRSAYDLIKKYVHRNCNNVVSIES